MRMESDGNINNREDNDDLSNNFINYYNLNLKRLNNNNYFKVKEINEISKILY